MRARLRSEEGFGLVELLMSLVMLNIGILAIVAAFNSGALALQRASQTSTAATLAEKQMELYRGLQYSAIGLTLATATDATYTGDTACVGGSGSCGNIDATSPACPNASFPEACTPSRTVTGPDKVSYRVDTYITSQAVSGGRDVKRVTVVVRKTSTLKVLARLVSSFDASTGI